MQHNKLAKMVALATALLVAVLLVSFYFASRSYLGDAGLITLPSTGGDIDVDPGDLGQNGQLVDGVRIDTANVQRVVGTLHRPAEYRFTARTTQVYHSRSSEYLVSGAVKNENSAIVTQLVSRNGSAVSQAARHVVLTPDTYYAWPQGEINYHQGPRGDYSYDDAGGIPTYEDLLLLPQQSLLEADYVMYQQELCIMVLAQNPITGAQERYYISLNSSLLYAFESYYQGTLTYSMVQTNFSQEAVGEEAFLLPNGQTVSQAEQAQSR